MLLGFFTWDINVFFTKNKIIYIYKRKLVAIKKVKKLGPYNKANINRFKYLVRRFSNIILIIIIGSYILEIIRRGNRYII
jgi:hypothetical protein